MAEPFLPRGIVLPFQQRQRTGMRVRLAGDFVMPSDRDNTRDTGRPLVLDPNTRQRVANAHIDIFEQRLRLQNPHFHLDDITRQRILAAALDPHNTSLETITAAVQTATSTALPASALSQLDSILRQQGSNSDEYARALLRVSAGLTPEQAIAAYRALLAREASGDGMYAGNSSYVSNPSSVSMTNYMSTPYAATGMTYGTFDYLRNYRLPNNDRFSGLNILHAGEDSRRHGLDPSDRYVARNFATVDRYDAEGRTERNRLLEDLRTRTRNDAEMQRLRQAYHAATTDEERRRIAGEIHTRGRVLQGESGYTRFNAGRPDSRMHGAGGVVADEVIAGSVGVRAEHRLRLGEDAARTVGTGIAHTAPDLAVISAGEQAGLRRPDADAESVAALLAATNPVRTTPTSSPTSAAAVQTPTSSPTSVATVHTSTASPTVVAQNVAATPAQRPSNAPTMRA